MTVMQGRLGQYSLLYVYPPGESSEIAGVILRDPQTDELHIRLKEQLRSRNEDLAEIWGLLSEDLLQESRQQGGAFVLDRLESTLSHTFRITDQSNIRIVDPESTVNSLFQEHITRVEKVLGDLRTSPVESVQEEIKQAIKRVPVFPQVALDALAALQDERLSDEQIASIVEQDSALAAHIVRLSNSPLFFYVGRRKENSIRSVSQAIRQLGTKNARRQIIAHCLRPLFSPPQLRPIWNHSLIVAQAARTLAADARYPDPEEALLVGLIHDIGNSVIAVVSPPLRNEYSRLLEQGHMAVHVEQALFGKSHAQIGADLLADWNFPKDFVEAVRVHHDLGVSALPLSGILSLAEAWAENTESEYALADHSRALTLARVRPTAFRSFSSILEPDLEELRLAA